MDDYEDEEDYGDDERCRECIYAYDFRPNPDNEGVTVNSCTVYPEDTRGFWYSDCARPACGKYAKTEREHPYIKHNQLKYYKAM